MLRLTVQTKDSFHTQTKWDFEVKTYQLLATDSKENKIYDL